MLTDFKMVGEMEPFSIFDSPYISLDSTGTGTFKMVILT